MHALLRFFLFEREIIFLGKFSQKNNPIYRFKLKFGAQANSSMQNSM